MCGGDNNVIGGNDGFGIGAGEEVGLEGGLFEQPEGADALASRTESLSVSEDFGDPVIFALL